MTDKKKLNILYTNIGRGHPFYLDGICKEIQLNYSDKIEPNIINVFDLSSDLSLWLWKLIRFMYKSGSQGGLFGKLYSIIRKNKKTDNFGIIEKTLAHGIREQINKNNHPTLVGHPILIPMIADITEVYYQHGELVVPEMVTIKSKQQIFVPTDNAKIKFCKKSVNENNISVTGLCIENSLKENAEKYYKQRVERLSADKPLIGAFFSSGAEPIGHINKIIKMVLSLNRNNQKAIVFCKAEGRLEKEIQNKINETAIYSDKKLKDITEYFDNNNILVVAYNNRSEENKCTETLFECFDYFVSPSHERTNWALGLGIPMFLLHPLIGPFSPLNRNILINNKVADEIIDDKSANSFSEILKQLCNNKKLISMSQNGFGKYPLNGFAEICKSLDRSL